MLAAELIGKHPELIITDRRCGPLKAATPAVPIILALGVIVFEHTEEETEALFKQIAELLRENPGVLPEEVFVQVFNAPKENWSFGHGLPQFA